MRRRSVVIKYKSWQARRVNIYRAMGMPVPGYWLRRADRKIDEERRRAPSSPADIFYDGCKLCAADMPHDTCTKDEVGADG
jgi:hypothetical protein